MSAVVLTGLAGSSTRRGSSLSLPHEHLAKGGGPVTIRGTRAELPAAADLARALREGVRSAASLEVTGPIREAVEDRVKQMSAGSAIIASTPPPPTGGSHVQFLDHVDLGTEGLFPVMRMNQWLIWWGIYSWGTEEQAEKISNAAREIGLVEAGWSVEHGAGGPDMPAAVWGTGGFFRAFKRLTVQQVEQLETLEGLVSRIANDLWWWHQRLQQVKLLAQFVK